MSRFGVLLSAAATVAFASQVGPPAGPPGAPVVPHSVGGPRAPSHGVVLAAWGPNQPVAKIGILAWPNKKTLRALHTGATIPLVTLGTTSTTSTGAYSLNVDISQLGSRYRESNGSVNVEVRIATPTQGATVYLPLHRSKVSRDPTRVTLPPYSFDLVHRRVTGPGLRVPEHLAVFRTAEPAADWIPEPSPSPGPDGPPCRGTAGRWLPDREEHFLNVWAWRGAKATVTESTGSTHTLGVGVRTGSGPWTFAGHSEETWSHDMTVSTPPISNNRAVGNAVNYRIFRLRCGASWFQTSVRSMGIDALLPSRFIHRKIRPIRFRHCVSYDAGQAIQIHDSANVTYGGGVDLGFVSLSAHASLTDSTQEIFIPTRRTWICGNNRYYITRSTRVAAVRPR